MQSFVLRQDMHLYISQARDSVASFLFEVFRARFGVPSFLSNFSQLHFRIISKFLRGFCSIKFRVILSHKNIDSFRISHKKPESVRFNSFLLFTILNISEFL